MPAAAPYIYQEDRHSCLSFTRGQALVPLFSSQIGMSGLPVLTVVFPEAALAVGAPGWLTETIK